MSAIDIRNAEVTYGAHTVLSKLDLHVAEGEFIVLLGASGCGKSTLLNAIAGLIDLSAGEVWIGGRNVTWAEPHERGIGMVFQSYALYPRMTVKGNMSFGLKMARVPRDEIERRVARAADVLKIGNLLQRRPAELSGGQRQRVAIGRALVRDVDVFLFDEPLSNLDAKLRGQMRVEIRRLQRALKTTSVYVTHDQLEAMTLADRLVVMNGGRIEQVGVPTELYEKPESLFVAGFIGSPPMNFLEMAYLREHGGGDLGSVPGDADIVGVRPDALTLERPTGPSIEIKAILELLEPVGGESHLHMRLDGSSQLIVVEVHGRPNIAEGASQSLYADAGQFHCFNKESGRRVN